MPLTRVSAPALSRSASVPAHRRYADESLLPDILHASAQHLQATSPTKLSSWPSRTTQPHTQWECKPAALEEIEDFISSEIHRLPKSMDSSVRLQVFREAFDLFIAHFKAYAAPLSEIKRAYDAHITELLRVARADMERDKNTELIDLFERTTSSLRSELRHKEKQLASTMKQLRELQKQHIAMLEEDARGPFGGGPVSKLQGAVQASKRSAALLKAFEGACEPAELAEAVQKLSGQMAKPQQLAACATSAKRLDGAQQVQLAAELLERLPAKDRARLLPLLARRATNAAKKLATLETAVADLCAELEPSARAAAVGAAVGPSADLSSRLALLRPQLAVRPPRPSAATEQQAASDAASRGYDATSLGHSDALLLMLLELWGGAASERAAALLRLLPPEQARSIAQSLLAGESALGGQPPQPAAAPAAAPTAAPAASPAAASAAAPAASFYQPTRLGPDAPEAAAARFSAPPSVEVEGEADMRVEVVQATDAAQST